MLIQQVANGLMLGGTYALVAIGYSLVFGVLRLIHLAHGEVFMVGAYIGLEVMLALNVGPVAALAAAVVGTAILGVVLELIIFRPIRRKGGSFLAPMVTSIGAGLILQEVFTKIFGAEQSEFPSGLGGDVYHVGPLLISATQLFIMAIAILSMIALHLFISRTRYGMAMRAAAENVEIASLLGINTDAVIMLTFAVASALAGIAGVSSVSLTRRFRRSWASTWQSRGWPSCWSAGSVAFTARWWGALSSGLLKFSALPMRRRRIAMPWRSAS